MAEAERIIGTPDVEGAEPEERSAQEPSSQERSSGASSGARSSDVRPDPEPEPESEPGQDGAAGPDAAKSKGKRKIAVLFAVALFAYLLDLGSKMLVVAKLEHHEPIELIGDLLKLHAIRNPGAAFGMGEAFTIVFTFIAATVIVVIAKLARKLYSLPWAVALGLLLGGALGNLTDRIFRSPGVFEGAVVDFIAPAHFAVFNLADSAIVCGGILIVILSFKGLDPDGTVHKD